MQDEFRNEAFTDFSKEENARAMREALARVKSELGREYPLVVGGERVKTGDFLESLNPAKKTEVVGRFHKATPELARAAVEKADEAFRTWSRTLPQQRADLLFRVASLLRERRHYFSAWMVHEVAKSWPEADGDTAEAIDFCDFYAREMLRYAAPQPLVKIAGEENRLDLHPARRRRRHPAVELPARHHGGHDRGLGRHRQHGRPQALFGRAGHRLQVLRAARRGGDAARRRQLHDRLGRGGRRRRSSITRRRATSRSPARRRSACASTSARRR